MKRAFKLLTSFTFSIQEHVHGIARPTDGESGTFNIRGKWNRFKAFRKANKDVRRLLEEVKVSQTNTQ